MKNERGEIALAFIILMVVIALVFVGLLATCDALWDDRDEPNDLGAPALVLNHGRDSDGKCQDAKACDDRDFNVTTDKLYVCLPNATCNWGKDEAAALLPPNPARLIETIQKGAEGIGAAAGALAGAVAAFPPALLL